ncbi:Dur3p PWA37_005117 [Arxiozyma heterogenica]
MQYNYDVFSGYTYSAGASFQIIAFSILAIKAKKRFPTHTLI